MHAGGSDLGPPVCRFAMINFSFFNGLTMEKRTWMLLGVLLTVAGCGKTPQVDQAAQPVLNAPADSPRATAGAASNAEAKSDEAKLAAPGATAGLPSSAEESKADAPAATADAPSELPDSTAKASSEKAGANPSGATAGSSGSAEANFTTPLITPQIGDEANQYVLEVSNLSEAELKAIEKLDAAGRNELLKVFVAEFEGVPALNGEVTLSDGKLRFTPRFPLEQGVRYRSIFHPVAGGSAVATEWDIAKEPVIGTALLEIYPSAEKLPENQLKFYLHFSAPMSRGEAYRHIHLIAGDGKEVEAPFLELGEELWDPTMTRFTLLCDPGRVKRGLKPREEVGPVLEEGKVYSLVIDSAWRDANGNPMASGGGRGIDTVAPDDTPVDPQTWKVEPPASGSRDPLVVRFGESLDHAMLERVIAIKPVEGEKLEGTIEITEHETTWAFTPTKPWAAGRYQMVVATTLEDLAGNSIGRAFEVDEERPIEKQLTAEFVTVDFEIGETAAN